MHSRFYTKPGNGHWAATSVVNADQEEIYKNPVSGPEGNWIRRNQRTV